MEQRQVDGTFLTLNAWPLRAHDCLVEQPIYIRWAFPPASELRLGRA